jgi:hypothetical protein
MTKEMRLRTTVPTTLVVWSQVELVVKLAMKLVAISPSILGGSGRDCSTSLGGLA